MGVCHVSVFSMRCRSRWASMAKAPTNNYTLRNVQEFIEILTFAATKVLVINNEFLGLRRERSFCGFLERAT